MQTLSLSEDKKAISISNGNSIVLPDDSPTNELQTLSLNNGILTLSNDGGAVTLPDASPTNELQSISISNTGALSITDGNFVQLPDASSTNELQTLVIDGNTLSITNGNSVQLPVSGGSSNQTLALSSGQLSISNGNTIQLPDASAANELQALTLAPNGNLSISQGNSVQLPDASATNELQSLSVSTSGDLSISQGNTVQLPMLRDWIAAAPSLATGEGQYVPLKQMLKGGTALSLESPDKVVISRSGTYLITLTAACGGTSSCVGALVSSSGTRYVGYWLSIPAAQVSSTQIGYLQAGDYLRWKIDSGNVVISQNSESCGINILLLG